MICNCKTCKHSSKAWFNENGYFCLIPGKARYLDEPKNNCKNFEEKET